MTESISSLGGAWRRTATGAGLVGPDGNPVATIFAEMSQLASATGAINLGQGFPDDSAPPEVLEAAQKAIRDGINQYPPGAGNPVLKQAIAEHQARFWGIDLDPGSEVLVTAGATEAIAAAILALTDDGDEVIAIEPYYDEYAAIAALGRTRLVTVPVDAPTFLPTIEQIAAAVTDRSRILIINTPHNPSGAVWSAALLSQVIELAHERNLLILSDEVYEHLTFDGVTHVPPASLPGGFERTVTIGSGGKTFATTGWKVGWATGPAVLITAIQAVKQYLTYVNGAPFQPAIAVGLGLGDEVFAAIAQSLQDRRDLLVAGLDAAGFSTLTPSAGYFVIADARPLGVDDASAFAHQLPQTAGVVGIPVAALTSVAHRTRYASLMRFAFCKDRELLQRAAAQLSESSARPSS